jgi:hypothetical protein
MCNNGSVSIGNAHRVSNITVRGDARNALTNDFFEEDDDERESAGERDNDEQREAGMGIEEPNNQS